MPLNPDWEKVRKCRIWPALGVTECDSCPKHDDCWLQETK